MFCWFRILPNSENLWSRYPKKWSDIQMRWENSIGDCLWKLLLYKLKSLEFSKRCPLLAIQYRFRKLIIYCISYLEIVATSNVKSALLILSKSWNYSHVTLCSLISGLTTNFQFKSKLHLYLHLCIFPVVLSNKCKFVL